MGVKAGEGIPAVFEDVYPATLPQEKPRQDQSVQPFVRSCPGAGPG